MKYIAIMALMTCFAASVAAHEPVEADFRGEVARLSDHMKEVYSKHVEAMDAGVTEAYIQTKCREKMSLEMRIELANPKECGDALRSLSELLNFEDQATQLQVVEHYKDQHGL
jgi:hypothetical protein